jgi:hypothetical protein
VQDEPLCTGLEAAILLQEDRQGVAQPGVAVVVVVERPERPDNPGPQELGGHRPARSSESRREAAAPDWPVVRLGEVVALAAVGAPLTLMELKKE